MDAPCPRHRHGIFYLKPTSWPLLAEPKRQSQCQTAENKAKLSHRKPNPMTSMLRRCLMPTNIYICMCKNNPNLVMPCELSQSLERRKEMKAIHRHVLKGIIYCSFVSCVFSGPLLYDCMRIIHIGSSSTPPYLTWQAIRVACRIKGQSHIALQCRYVVSPAHDAPAY
jgi:hypothetical protein